MDDSREVCVECGFDSTRWRVRDAVTHMAALGWWWRNALAGLEQVEVARRPAPAVWSALEYGLHSVFATAVLRESVERVLAGDSWNATDRVNPLRASATPDDDLPSVALDQLFDDLEREGRDMAALARGAAAQAWTREVERAGRPPLRADLILFHAVHDASHHQMDVGRVLSSLGLGAVGAGRGCAGRVAQISTSAGGVPKSPVYQIDITPDGLVGDRQADKEHHGRPFQAVCLWSIEALADLTADGHHLFAGAVGENLTVGGLDWTTLRPGARLRIGSSLLELSFPAVPCQKQAQWFTDGDFTRLTYENNPKWCRWYGWVREPGSVTTNDEVLLV